MHKINHSHHLYEEKTKSTGYAHRQSDQFAGGSARLIRLRANDGEDENSLPNPTNIYPTNHELSPECNGINVELPAYSLNIIRIKKLVVSDKKIKKTTKFLEH